MRILDSRPSRLEPVHSLVPWASSWRNRHMLAWQPQHQCLAAPSAPNVSLGWSSCCIKAATLCVCREISNLDYNVTDNDIKVRL